MDTNLNAKRIALLIDGDNTSPDYLDVINDELSKIGSVDIKRVYGDFTNPTLSCWNKDVLNKYSLIPIEVPTYTAGKNTSDIALAIDAMDILFTKNIDCFCIATSDSDFIRLTQRIREEGKVVIGMGRQHTLPAFVNACNEFKYLDVLYASSDDECNLNNDDITSITPINDVYSYICDFIVNNDGAGHLGGLKSSLKQKFTDFDERNYGYSKFSTFIDSFEQLKVETTGHSNFATFIFDVDNEKLNIEKYLIKQMSLNINKKYSVVELHNFIAQEFKNFKLENYGYSNMKAFLKSMPNIQKNNKNKYYCKEK